MPYKSLAQERFFNSATGKAKVGQKVVNEFNAASKGMSLPKKIGVAKGGGKNLGGTGSESRPGRKSWEGTGKGPSTY